MHWCTDCRQACFCDGDDTDYGDAPLGGLDNCTHECDDADCVEDLWDEYDEEECREDKNIYEMPTAIKMHMVYETYFRSFHILEKVKTLLQTKVDYEQIIEFIQRMEYPPANVMKIEEKDG